MTPMQSALQSLEGAIGNYLKDLDVMSEDQLTVSAGGAARKAADFTYEIATINQRVAMRLRGETPPPSPDEDEEKWAVAPEELRSKAAITEFFRSSCDQLLAAAKAVPEAESGNMIGEEPFRRPIYGLVNFMALHIMYHDAQLNFIQTLSGDLKMHWF